MKKIELIFVQLRHFKGLEKVVIELNGKDATIYGTNGSGKTTIFDSITWLLFDKDSNNDAKFALQTIERATGKKIKGLEHEAKGLFAVDGVQVELTKVYREVWQTQRGTNVKTFKGHTTDHFIDGVPVSKKEYVARIDTIVKEDLFKLLTSSSYFNEQLKWQDRRAILVEMSGGVSNEEIFAKDESLKRIETILNDKSVEDMKKVIASKKKKIDDEIKSLPIRIDEIYKGMPDLQIDTSALKDVQAKAAQEIEALRVQKMNVQNGGAIAKKRAELSELVNNINIAKQQYLSQYTQKSYEAQAKLQECHSNVKILESAVAVEQANNERYTAVMKRFSEDIENTDRELQGLRLEFIDVRDKIFEHGGGCDECPTCKQALPPEQVEAARNEAEKQFEQDKEKRLIAINQKGKDLKAHREVLSERYANGRLEVLNVEKRLEKALNNLNEAKKQLAKVEKVLKEQTAPVYEESADYEKLASERDAIAAAIADLESNQAEVIKDIDDTINAAVIQKETIDAELAKYAGVEASKARIAELESKQQTLAAEYEQLEGDSYVIEEYTRQKVSMLEEKINGLFEHTTFKLFEDQVNGGLVETCVALHNNVPYGKGLNNAAKVTVGLDIINTLSTYYKFSAPIFVDNAEAVVDFIDVQAQLIKLVVSEQDKTLRVVTH